MAKTKTVPATKAQPRPQSSVPSTPVPPSKGSKDKSGKKGNPYEDLGSAQVKIQQAIRYRVVDPYTYLNMGGSLIVEKTIVALSSAVSRHLASKIELNALMGLKLEMSSVVAECLRKGTLNEVKTSIKPWQSILLGIIFTLFMGIVIPFVVLDLPFFPSLCVMGIAIGMFIASFNRIDIAHMGVLTLLGRRQRIFLDEGIHWLPWPFMDQESVDMRERVISLEEKDGIDAVAGNAEDASNEMPKDFNISKAIDREFQTESGVKVIDVLNTEILPTNTEILRAMEEEMKEAAKSKAQKRDMEEQGKRAVKLVAQFKAMGKDLDPTEALRMVQAQEGNLTRQEIIVNGVGEGDKMVGGLTAVFGQRDNSKNQGKSK